MSESLNRTEVNYQLKKVTNLISDGTHFTPNYLENCVKFLSVKDVRAFEINYSNSKFISEEEANLLDKNCKPKQGDVLLTKIGTMGLASVINSDERFQIFVSVALLRPDLNFISPDFLALCLNANFIYLQFERVIKGAGVPDLHLEDIRKIKIPIPSLDRQAEVAAVFKSAYASKKQKEADATALLGSKDSYLLQALGITLPPLSEKKACFYTRSYKVSGGRFDPLFHQTDIFSIFKMGKSSLVMIKEITNYLKTGFAAGKQDQDLEETEVIQIRPTNIKDPERHLNFDKNIYIKSSEVKKAYHRPFTKR